MTLLQRDEMLSSYLGACDRVQDTLAGVPKGAWMFRPSADEWTIHEVVIHLADMEANAYVRLMKALAEPGGTIMPVDQVQWTRRLYYHEQDAEIALALFRLLRFKTHNVLCLLQDEQWQLKMRHPESGLLSIADYWLPNYEQHPYGHIEQIKRIYGQWLNTGITSSSTILQTSFK